MQKIVNKILALVIRHPVPIQAAFAACTPQLCFGILHPFLSPLPCTRGQRQQCRPLRSGGNCFTKSTTCASLNSRIGMGTPPQDIVAERCGGSDAFVRRAACHRSCISGAGTGRSGGYAGGRLNTSTASRTPSAAIWLSASCRRAVLVIPGMAPRWRSRRNRQSRPIGPPNLDFALMVARGEDRSIRRKRHGWDRSTSTTNSRHSKRLGKLANAIATDPSRSEGRQWARLKGSRRAEGGRRPAVAVTAGSETCTCERGWCGWDAPSRSEGRQWAWAESACSPNPCGVRTRDESTKRTWGRNPKLEVRNSKGREQRRVLKANCPEGGGARRNFARNGRILHLIAQMESGDL